jgi:hypothetical protein
MKVMGWSLRRHRRRRVNVGRVATRVSVHVFLVQLDRPASAAEPASSGLSVRPGRPAAFAATLQKLVGNRVPARFVERALQRDPDHGSSDGNVTPEGEESSDASMAAARSASGGDPLWAGVGQPRRRRVHSRVGNCAVAATIVGRASGGLPAARARPPVR